MPMMNDDGLLECPCCASTDVFIDTDDDGWRAVVCTVCELQTGRYRNDKLMRYLWNTRGGHLYAAQDFKDAAWERRNSDLIK